MYIYTYIYVYMYTHTPPTPDPPTHLNAAALRPERPGAAEWGLLARHISRLPAKSISGAT